MTEVEGEPRAVSAAIMEAGFLGKKMGSRIARSIDRSPRESHDAPILKRRGAL